jgi:hypothetical protein
MKNLVAVGITATLYLLALPSIVAAQTFDLKVIDDVRQEPMRYFNRTYNGKNFSDIGVVTSYAQSARFTTVWYVQMQGQNNNSAYCIVGANEGDPRLKQLQAKFPVGSKIRMTGVIAEFVESDQTLRLNDFCSIVGN